MSEFVCRWSEGKNHLQYGPKIAWSKPLEETVHVNPMLSWFLCRFSPKKPSLDTAMSGWNKGGKRRKPGRRRCSSRTPPRPRKPLPLHAGRKMMNPQGPCPISTMGTTAGHPEPQEIPRTRDSTTSLSVLWFLFMVWWSVVFWMFHQFPNDPKWCILCGVAQPGLICLVCRPLHQLHRRQPHHCPGRPKCRSRSSQGRHSEAAGIRRGRQRQRTGAFMPWWIPAMRLARVDCRARHLWVTCCNLAKVSRWW